MAAASVNPARAIRLTGRERGLQTDEIADLVRFRYDAQSGEVTILETILQGETVYRSTS